MRSADTRLCCAGGQAHGVMLLNSNGMDVVLRPTSASFRVIGGVLDLYILAGPTPLAVLEQLTAIIGRPMMVPAWSLGLMNSKCALTAVCALLHACSPVGVHISSFWWQVRLHVSCPVSDGAQRLRQRQHPPVSTPDI